ncbi:hypothetical protein [Ralstonia solanacearum]|uniref:hypothetical protein n=1 Tax=Ralstonia solanacearum TaxID=305 RepID=UPI0011C472DD|nr:hypothetical protein [Ralstonia solanacearum]
MPFRNMLTDEVRNVVRHQIETLERWLRSLLDDALQAHYCGSLSGLPIKPDIVKQAVERRNREPQRYPREVDALLFENLVDIICHPQLYNPHFKDGLKDAFPQGEQEARFFLKRVLEARNPVSHANDITSHQALRAICYSNDVIASLKSHYERNNLEQTYNAPVFLKIWDNFGNSEQVDKTHAIEFKFNKRPLRPGDAVHLEVQPDESFGDDTYRIEWMVCNVGGQGEKGLGRSFFLTLDDKHVTQDGLPIQVVITSNKNWHRHGQFDALLIVRYPVLPPI